MSSRKTDYLNMHDWVGTDPWRRSEISENFQKLDNKAKKLDESSASATAISSQAKTTAEGIDAKAESALTNSANAVQSATSANQVANAANANVIEAKGISDQALAVAQDAKTVSTSAESTSQSVRGELDRVIADAGGNNPEVVAARGNDVNLGARLNGLGQQLAEKIGQGVKAEPEDLSENTIALLTGQGSINLLSIPQDDSVTLDKMEPSLRVELSDFLDTITNENAPWEVV
ncbi:hypothetical protein [Planococcus faecalis]|uniref:Uncharacterized protein n=1 Tax=Planococcus faecalis TaxID=1598147 RepID=A0ABN4XPZ1_9BACL|nr:hypothetical protein [Planococcus faecalis]AQU79705.1 hypothetical protein AJGP001_10715 [Planococcus faecalis]OHX55283.1 hypothetical protein BB777_04385 [Planococcus faecalis]